MKKIILLAILALSGLAQAQQITVVTPGGGTINDGDSFTNSSLEPIDNNGPNKLRFNVTNNTEETIYVSVKVNSFSGNTPIVDDLTHLQLCFGVCVYEITPNMLVPDNGFAIDGGTTTTGDNHFASIDPGANGVPVHYDLSFVIVDENMAILSTPITFDYTYQPNAGLTDLNSLAKMGLTLESNIVKNSLNINATQNAAMQLYDATGKLVKTSSIKNGGQAVDFSAVSTGVYFARFTTADNKIAQVKIVKN